MPDTDRYTYKDKANYHAQKSKKGALSANGNPLSDFARGRHSALAQVNYAKSRAYRNKKLAEEQAKKYGYASLAAFNASPEGRQFQVQVRAENEQYRKASDERFQAAIRSNRSTRTPKRSKQKKESRVPEWVEAHIKETKARMNEIQKELENDKTSKEELEKFFDEL